MVRSKVAERKKRLKDVEDDARVERSRERRKRRSGREVAPIAQENTPAAQEDTPAGSQVEVSGAQVEVLGAQVEVDGYLSPMALRFLVEYRKSLSADDAFNALGIEDKAVRERFLGSVKLRKEMQVCREVLEVGARWGAAQTRAKALRLYEKMEMMLDEGGVSALKAAASMVNLLRTELEAHGELRREEQEKGVVVNVSFDLSGKGQIVDG